MWKTQNLSNKLAGYGHATHQCLFASIIILDAMFKLTKVDFPYRISYLKQRLEDISNIESKFEAHIGTLINSNENLCVTESINGLRVETLSGPADMGYPSGEIRGNPKDGFEFRLSVLGQDRPFRPVTEGPSSSRYLKMQNIYGAAENKVEGIEKGVLIFVRTARKNVEKLISRYEKQMGIAKPVVNKQLWKTVMRDFQRLQTNL